MQEVFHLDCQLVSLLNKTWVLPAKTSHRLSNRLPNFFTEKLMQTQDILTSYRGGEEDTAFLAAWYSIYITGGRAP